jgi:hypothetical protein
LSSSSSPARNFEQTKERTNLMMMKIMSGHCFASTMLLACSICFYWPQVVSARIIPRRARRRTAANVFNGTFVRVNNDAGLLLPVWATRAEEQVRLDWKMTAAKKGNYSSLLGSSSWNEQTVFQQQASVSAVRQEPLRIPAEYEPVSTGTPKCFTSMGTAKMNEKSIH